MLQKKLTFKNSSGGFSASGSVVGDAGDEVDSVSGFTSRTLMVLKGKTSPETRLSTADLQVKNPHLLHIPSEGRITPIRSPSLSPHCDRTFFTQLPTLQTSDGLQISRSSSAAPSGSSRTSLVRLQAGSNKQQWD